jgi:hypothetical protein
MFSRVKHPCQRSLFTLHGVVFDISVESKTASALRPASLDSARTRGPPAPVGLRLQLSSGTLYSAGRTSDPRTRNRLPADRPSILTGASGRPWRFFRGMNSTSRGAIIRGSPSFATQPAKSTARFSIRDHGSNAAHSPNNGGGRAIRPGMTKPTLIPRPPSAGCAIGRARPAAMPA